MGTTESKPDGDATKQEPQKELQGYTMKEVAQHKTLQDLWLVIDGKVYDVSSYVSDHPGGAGILFNHAGEDASEGFEEVGHSGQAKAIMKTFLIGKVVESKPDEKLADAVPADEPPLCDAAPYSQLTVLYGSQSGFTQGIARKIALKCKEQLQLQVVVKSMEDFEPEDLCLKQYVVFVVSTLEGGKPPINAKFMLEWLEDAVTDHRITTSFMDQARTGVFGVGSSDYEQNYNVVAHQVADYVSQLGAGSIIVQGQGDVSDSRDAGSIDSDVDVWVTSLVNGLQKGPMGEHVTFIKKEDDTAAAGGEDSEQEDVAADDDDDDEHGLVDLEDIGSVMHKAATAAKEPKGPPREMLTDTMRKNLSKQGYKLLGSHSGVKLCRWTKAMLRGRGGCYKHTFYGISSYQCMEMTPSLACANKCVFCWRHHTNPVGKEWKWVTDPPEMLLEQAVNEHRKMIKQMKGVPGVKKERFEDAFNVKHCALSLVGEPIMYPHINEYVKLLHGRGISSFLVTNAQFPDRILSMDPVTQLYVSVDAATKDALKAVDRPLFTDFWERFIGSLTAMKDKGIRTVYRLTLVKQYNMEELQAYKQLVALGMPTFIEVKGVTFCGEQNSANITMANVPFHHEVKKFCEALVEVVGDDYELACEHVHSCCILISHKSMKVDGKWNTWIDYPKFHQLTQEYYATGKTFTYMDYMEPTPDWAIYNSPAEGFDPEETRWRRKGKGPTDGEGEGCGG